MIGRNRSGPRNVIRGMRDVEVIDQELALLAVVRTAVRREGGRPSTSAIDELLDERLHAADRGRAVQHLTH